MSGVFAPLPPTRTEIHAIVQQAIGCSPRFLEPLRDGAWSRAIAFDSDRGKMVLRFSSTDDDFFNDATAAGFSAPNLPIPEVNGIGFAQGLYWCISSWMPGKHIDDLDAVQMERVIPSIADMLEAMRNVDAADTSGYGGWDSSGNGVWATFADQLLDVAIDRPQDRGGGWSSRLRNHLTCQRIFDDGMKELESLEHYIPGMRQLIHQDTLNYNVVTNNDRLSGIFDWGCAMWGDALYDLAWFRFWMPWYPQWRTLELPHRLEERVGRIGPDVSERMRAYLLHIGLMHIRYNAMIENWTAMTDVAEATAHLLRSDR